MITIEQFRFEFAGYGHYWATYTTPNRGDYWRHIINCMPLIDATKNADNPTQRYEVIETSHSDERNTL